ncbi:chaplin [Streptomyces sp. NPDC004065]|uniref:chaplin n=1 Tax=Streptomyces sp. NPDC004065 TaxID=3364689 RepID=UPI0038508AB5
MAITVPVAAAFAADGGAAADAAAVGSGGVISGNTMQIPVHLPVNVCGNTVTVAGVLNSSAGNHCAHESAGGDGASSAGGASALGGGKDSSGEGSGNVVQLPVHLPVNASGNTVDVAGIGNESVGNSSTSESGPDTDEPAPAPVTPPERAKPHPLPEPVGHTAPEPHTQVSLAQTGADETLPAVAASAALLLGGAALYRRYRPGSAR